MLNTHSQRLIAIVGASGRQIAEIAQKSGFHCKVIDLFSDRDTRLICDLSHDQIGGPTSARQSTSSSDLNTLVELAQQRQSLVPAFDDVFEILICGGLERRSELLEAIAQTGLMRSVSVEAMNRMGDPNQINLCFENLRRDAGLASLELFMTAEEFWNRHDETDDPNEAFIFKSLRSCGGQSVRLVDQETHRLQLPTDIVFQKLIAGTPISALYCSVIDRSGGCVQMLGVTEQMIGESFCIAKPFQYCGAISGYELSAEHQSHVASIGQAVASCFKLRGVFGVDFIHNADGVVPVDINPRFTASTEIVQRAELESQQRNVIDLHLAAVSAVVDSTEQVKESAIVVSEEKTVYGKAILFNGREGAFVFPESVIELFPMSYTVNQKQTSIADVPMPGTMIQTCAPILSLLASGDSVADVRCKLEKSASEVYKAIGKV